MDQIRYSQELGSETKTEATFSQCSAKINTDAALVQSAQELSDTTVENIAVLLTQRQVVAQKMLDHKLGGSSLDIMANTMDYINDELRKLLAL